MKIVNIHHKMRDIPNRGISTIRGTHLTQQDCPVRIKDLLNIVGVDELERRNKTVIYHSEVKGTQFLEDLPPAFAKEYSSLVDQIKTKSQEIKSTEEVVQKLREHVEFVKAGKESPHKDLFQSITVKKETPSQ